MPGSTPDISSVLQASPQAKRVQCGSGLLSTQKGLKYMDGLTMYERLQLNGSRFVRVILVQNHCELSCKCGNEYNQEFLAVSNFCSPQSFNIGLSDKENMLVWKCSMTSTCSLKCSYLSSCKAILIPHTKRFNQA